MSGIRFPLLHWLHAPCLRHMDLTSSPKKCSERLGGASEGKFAKSQVTSTLGEAQYGQWTARYRHARSLCSHGMKNWRCRLSCASCPRARCPPLRESPKLTNQMSLESLHTQVNITVPPPPREEKPSVNDSQGRRPGHPGAPGSPRIHVETVYVELRIVARTMAIKIISVALGLVACMRSLQTSGSMARCLLFKR